MILKICCVLIFNILISLNFKETGARNIHHTVHSEDDDTDIFLANVVVHGDPRLHDNLVIHVTTSVDVHNVSVSRVHEHVLHPEAEGFVVSEDQDGSTVFTVHKMPDDIHDHASQFFSDDTSGTIVSVVHGDDGNVNVEGLLNDMYVIAPPGSQRRHRRSLKAGDHTLYKQDQASHGSSDALEVPKIFLDKSRWIASKNRHYKKDLWPFDFFKNYPSTNDIHSIFSRSGKRREIIRSRRQTKEPATAEVLVIIDKEMFKNFNYSMSDLGLFLLHYWQAVNFKFQGMKDPSIRLKIRQYGAFQLGKYQPFIEENRIGADQKKISLHDTLRSFRDWMKKYESNKNFVSHDIAILQTGEDLCEKTQNGECFKMTSGIGFVGGACITARAFPDYTYDVAISEIGKSFKGVLVTVHEIGHLLGAHHDGEGESSACPKDSGYVMSYQRDHAYNFSRFSHCSKTSINNFLKDTWYSQCLRKTDTEGYEYPALLPGQYMSIHDQCDNYVGGTPCPASVYPLSERCERLCCEKNGYRIKRREPAVDGTDCGPGKVCFNGECLPSTEIPS